MDTEPLKQYIEAIEAYKNGKKEEALKLIADSIGADEPTAIMKDSLDSLVNINPVILKLILHRSK